MEVLANENYDVQLFGSLKLFPLWYWKPDYHLMWQKQQRDTKLLRRHAFDAFNYSLSNRPSSHVIQYCVAASVTQRTCSSDVSANKGNRKSCPATRLATSRELMYLPDARPAGLECNDK